MEFIQFYHHCHHNSEGAKFIHRRLANEVHSTASLENNEWLEKLTLVVLKAEEIIYSKANSEVHATTRTYFLFSKSQNDLLVIWWACGVATMQSTWVPAPFHHC